MSGNHMIGAFGWPEAAVAVLRQRKAEGATSRMIADELSLAFGHNVSRNAVIGKAMRLGIELSPLAKSQTISLSNSIRAPKKAKAAKARPTPEEVAARRAADLIKAAKKQAKEDGNVVTLHQHPDDIATEPKGIFGLSHSSCRWPLDRTAEDGSTLFCCNTKASTGSYCDDHAKRAYSKTQTKEQKEVARLIREQNSEKFRAAGGRHSDAFGFGLSKRFA